MSSTISGRPVRFFVVLMSGWVIIRVASVAGDMLGFKVPDGPLPTPVRTAAARPLPVHIATATRFESRSQTVSGSPVRGATSSANSVRHSANAAAILMAAPELATGSAIAALPANRATPSSPAFPRLFHWNLHRLQRRIAGKAAHGCFGARAALTPQTSSLEADWVDHRLACGSIMT